MPAFATLFLSLARFHLAFDAVAGYILGYLHSQGWMSWTYIFDGVEEAFKLIQLSNRSIASYDNPEFSDDSPEVKEEGEGEGEEDTTIAQ